MRLYVTDFFSRRFPRRGGCGAELRLWKKRRKKTQTRTLGVPPMEYRNVGKKGKYKK